MRLSGTNTLTRSVRSQRLGLNTVTEASESPSGPSESVREVVDARPDEGVGSLASVPRETRLCLPLERP